MQVHTIIAALLVFSGISCRSVDLSLAPAAKTNLQAALEALSRFAELEATEMHLPEKLRERGQQGYIFERAMDDLGAALPPKIRPLAKQTYPPS